MADHRLGGTSTEIYDGLDSTSILAALSANMGRVLNEKITNTAADADIDAIF